MAHPPDTPEIILCSATWVCHRTRGSNAVRYVVRDSGGSTSLYPEPTGSSGFNSAMSCVALVCHRDAGPGRLAPLTSSTTADSASAVLTTCTTSDFPSFERNAVGRTTAGAPPLR